MPTIPKYERTQSIPGVSGNVQRDVNSAGVVGDGISQIADQVSGMVEERAAQIKEHDDINEGIRLSAMFDVNLTKYETGQLAKTGRDTYTNIEETETFLKNQIKELTKDTNNNIKSELTKYIYGQGRGTRNTLSKHQAVQKQFEIDKVHSDKVAAASVTAYGGKIDESFESVRESLELQFETGMISKDVFDTKLKTSYGVMTQSYIDGLVKNNPALAVKVIESKDLNEFLTKEQIQSFDGQAAALKGTIETFKVRDTFENVSELFTDPTEAINYLQKAGTAKKHGLSAAQNKQVIALFKDQRAEIKLAQTNKKDAITLEAENKKTEQTEAIKAEKNQIANDLFEFERTGDTAGQLEYINNIPDKYGDLKRQELNNYEADLKKVNDNNESKKAKERQLVKDAEVEQKKETDKKQKIELNKINNDIFNFESTNDLVGLEAYVNALDADKYGKLKRTELKNIDKLKKEAKAKQKGIVFSDAEKALADKIRFATNTVNESDIRSIGETTESTGKLLAMYKGETTKGNVQKRLEGRVKKATENLIAEKIAEEDKGFELWRGVTGGGFRTIKFTDKDMADIEQSLAVFYDRIDDLFEQFPDTTESQAQELYNTFVRPELAKKVTEVISRGPVKTTKPQIKTIATQDEVDALKKGESFIWTDGKTYTKGGK